MMKRLLFAVLGLALVGGLMVVETPAADAQTAGSGAVAFQGCTGNLPDPVDAIPGDVTPVGNPPQDRDTGSYSFATGSKCGPENLAGDVCVGAGATSDAEVAAGVCTISANGNFENIVCGTGFTGTLRGAVPGSAAPDTATTTINDVGDTLTLATNYGIAFVSGVGVIVGEPTALNGDAVNGVTEGVVQIAPVVGDCLTGDVVVFVATGAAAVQGVTEA